MNLESGPWASEEFWVSHLNGEPEVTKGYRLPQRVSIHDVTLRDGEQTPGVVFTPEEKVAIAQALSRLGVDRIEAGMPAVSDEDRAAMRVIAEMRLESAVYGFARALPKDVEMVAQCGASGVIIEVPSGYPRLRYQFEWPEDEALNRAVRAIRAAKEAGLRVVLFPYDTTRAEWSFLARLLTAAVEAGADAVAVVDTLGCATPDAVRYLVSRVQALVPVPVEVHTHNDFGMAVATTVAAVTAGASVVHVSVNGLGERCGNAPLEETAAALRYLLGLPLGVRFAELPAVSALVSRASGVPVPPNKPLVGERSFTRETGLGAEMLVRKPTVVWPIHPRVVGRRFTVLVGKKSGKESLALKLTELGLSVPQERLEALLADVKRAAAAKKGPLGDDEFRELATQYV